MIFGKFLFMGYVYFLFFDLNVQNTGFSVKLMNIQSKEQFVLSLSFKLLPGNAISDLRCFQMFSISIVPDVSVSGRNQPLTALTQH